MKTTFILFIFLFTVGCSFSNGESTRDRPPEDQTGLPTAPIPDTVTDNGDLNEPVPDDTPVPQFEIAPPVVFLPVREDEALPASQEDISTATISGLKLLYLSYRNSYSTDEYFWPEDNQIVIFPGINYIHPLTMWITDGEKPNCSSSATEMSGNGKLSVISNSTPETPASFAFCDIDTDQVIYQDQMMVWVMNGPNQEFYGFPGIQEVAISTDGQLLATGGYAAGWEGSRLTIWDLEEKGIRYELLPSNIVGVAPRQAEFSLDGNLLAASTYYETEQTNVAIMLWSMADGSLLHQIDGVSGDSLTFNPTGTLLAISDHTSIDLVDVGSGAVTKSIAIEGFDEFEWPNTVFSPDGSILVSYPSCLYNDQTMRFWDVETGELLTTAKGCGDRIAFSPDGKYLITNYKLVEGDPYSRGIAVYGIWNDPMISTLEIDPIEANCNHPYLPMVPGATWTYHLTYDAPQKDQNSRTVNNSIQERLVSSLDGINVWDVIQDEYSNEFQCGTQYDVWEQIAGSFRRLPPVDRMRPGFTWTESRSHNDDNGNPAPRTYFNTITAMDEPVQTPAGDFITTVIKQESVTDPKYTTTIWLAENVGIVRLVRTSESTEGLTQGIWELQSYDIP